MAIMRRDQESLMGSPFRSLFTYILKKEKCFISFLHLTITSVTKHTTVNGIFSKSPRSESKLSLLVKYTYTVLDSA